MSKEKKEKTAKQETVKEVEKTQPEGVTQTPPAEPAQKNTPEKTTPAPDKKKEESRLKASAKKVAEEQSVDTVYANSKGEFFTAKHYALSSEDGKEEKVQTFKF
jgi:hypothetical protein